jgi:hypothetical protein
MGGVPQLLINGKPLPPLIFIAPKERHEFSSAQPVEHREWCAHLFDAYIALAVDNNDPNASLIGAG